MEVYTVYKRIKTSYQVKKINSFEMRTVRRSLMWYLCLSGLRSDAFEENNKIDLR
jgi:hypothetical protein